MAKKNQKNKNDKELYHALGKLEGEIEQFEEASKKKEMDDRSLEWLARIIEKLASALIWPGRRVS